MSSGSSLFRCANGAIRARCGIPDASKSSYSCTITASQQLHATMLHEHIDLLKPRTLLGLIRPYVWLSVLCAPVDIKGIDLIKNCTAYNSSEGFSG